NTTGLVRGLSVALTLCAATAFGQRVRPPSMLDDADAGSYGASVAQAPDAFSAGPAPIVTPQPGVPAWDPYASPGSQPVPYSPYAPSPFAPPPPTGPRPLYPDGMTSPFPQGGDVFGQLQQPLRFLQEVRLRNTWLASTG